MGFRFREQTSGDDRRKAVDERRNMKPKPGDIVEYLSQRYVVTAVGNRICRMYPEGGSPKHVVAARLDMVLKIT